MTTVIRQTIEAPTQQTVNHSLRKPNHHPDLTGRELEDQHPISAITGLQEALENAGQVKDVEVDGQSVVNQDKVAQIDLSGKQDVINDLSTIRSGASLGATAVQYALVITDYTGD